MDAKLAGNWVDFPTEDGYWWKLYLRCPNSVSTIVRAHTYGGVVMGFYPGIAGHAILAPAPNVYYSRVQGPPVFEDQT